MFTDQEISLITRTLRMQWYSIHERIDLMCKGDPTSWPAGQVARLSHLHEEAASLDGIIETLVAARSV